MMVQIDKELVKRIAKHARLDLGESEAERLAPERVEILDHFSSLTEVDTKDISPSFHPVELKNSMRDDVLKDPLPEEIALSNVKFSKDGFIKGPKAVDDS